MHLWTFIEAVNPNEGEIVLFRSQSNFSVRDLYVESVRHEFNYFWQEGVDTISSLMQLSNIPGRDVIQILLSNCELLQPGISLLCH